MADIVPRRFIKNQIRGFTSMILVALRSAVPLLRPGSVPSKPVTKSSTLQAAAEDLVDHYAEWCGASSERYSDDLPPHFCSHWAIPMLAWLGGHAPYNVFGLLNQGVRLQVHGAIPRKKQLRLFGELVDVHDDGDRARIHSRVTAGVGEQNGQDKCITIDSYTVVMHRRIKEKSKRKEKNDIDFRTVGSWSANKNDGVNFALLTGDFNPIHTVNAVGRRSQFGGCILHGFGQFAKTYETLVNSGLDIAEIDIRWIKPVKLPSGSLKVQVAQNSDNQNRTPIQLIGSGGVVHLVGSIITK